MERHGALPDLEATVMRFEFEAAVGRLRDLALGPEPVSPRRNVDAAELHRLYIDERLPAAELADRFGVTVAAVQSRLRRAGIRRPAAVPAEQVVSLYEAGQSIRAVAAQVGIHQRDVWRELRRAGVTLRPPGTAGVVLSRSHLELAYVRDGLSLAEVARLFEVSPHMVARNLARYGIARRRPPLERAVLEELYVDEGLGIAAVAARLGVGAAQVRAGLAQHAIPVRRPGRPPK